MKIEKTIILLLLVSSFGFSQNAEYLFKEKYFKLGLELGSNLMFTENTSNPNLYEWVPFQTLNFGLVYNFYQKNNLNIKIAAIYSSFDLKEQKFYKLNNGNVISIETASGPYSLLIFPLETEYYFKLTDKTYFSLNSGIEFTFNPYGKDEGYSLSGFSSEGYSSQTSVVEYSREFPIYFGLNLGLSLNLATKPMLLKFNTKYHYQFENYIYEGIATTNINGDTSISKHNVTGNYIGIGLTIIPNKNIFKQK